MTLDDKDILQVDATIITGILILLTISNVVGIARVAQFLAASVSSVIPVFSASAVMILMSHLRAKRPSSSSNKLPAHKFSLFDASIAAMISGFVGLTSIIMLFFYVSYIAPHLFDMFKVKP